MITGKIEYGIFLYGFSSRQYMNKMQSLYNSAIRIALNAFRTTPINNMLFETKSPTVEDIRDNTINRLYKSILFCGDSPNSTQVKKNIKAKKEQKIKSVNYRIIEYCRNNNIPFKTNKMPTPKIFYQRCK